MLSYKNKKKTQKNSKHSQNGMWGMELNLEINHKFFGGAHLNIILIFRLKWLGVVCATHFMWDAINIYLKID